MLPYHTFIQTHTNLQHTIVLSCYHTILSYRHTPTSSILLYYHVTIPYLHTDTHQPPAYYCTIMLPYHTFIQTHTNLQHTIVLSCYHTIPSYRHTPTSSIL